jgi:hypothetical protein
LRTKRSHLSDEEILLFIDRELPARRHGRARAHLAECQACNKRRTELETTLSDFSRIREETVSPLDSNLLRSRSLLKARIAETALRSNHGSVSRLLRVGSMSWQLACAGIALVIVGAGYWATHEFKWNDRGSHSADYQAFALPRRTLTPGAVLPVAVGQLCGASAVENDPPVNLNMQQAVFREYGLPNSSRIAYALDYLVTPALGGSDDIKNLWPQPSSSTWNARVKDQLEDHLHDLVCQGKVQLTTAQNEIATDWISAYKRYFNTDKPQPNPATLAAADAKREFDPGAWRGLVFHNKGVAQEEYDAAIGQGAFGKLFIPTDAQREANFDAYMPASAAHPNATESFRHAAVAGNPEYADLSLWNIYLNPDIRNPQANLAGFVCASGDDCTVDKGIPAQDPGPSGSRGFGTIFPQRERSTI